MSIFVTGDCHGDFDRFDTQKFPQGKSLTRDDYVIISGDFGDVWSGLNADSDRLDWLEAKPFTTLFVDGNHENFDLLNKYSEVEWHGGRVHVVRPHVLHLMRGQIFEISNKKFFTMGGASTHNISNRLLDPEDSDFERKYLRARRFPLFFLIKGVSWWEAELPCEGEYEEACSNLEKVSWDVDYVITHCGPTSVVKALNPTFVSDSLTDFLETVREMCKFKKWYFGHYHISQEHEGKFVTQYREITRIE